MDLVECIKDLMLVLWASFLTLALTSLFTPYSEINTFTITILHIILITNIIPITLIAIIAFIVRINLIIITI
jgi:hypothetical protein